MIILFDTWRELEVQKSWVLCPRWHNWKMSELRISFWLVWFKSLVYFFRTLDNMRAHRWMNEKTNPTGHYALCSGTARRPHPHPQSNSGPFCFNCSTRDTSASISITCFSIPPPKRTRDVGETGLWLADPPDMGWLWQGDLETHLTDWITERIVAQAEARTFFLRGIFCEMLITKTCIHEELYKCLRYSQGCNWKLERFFTLLHQSRQILLYINIRWDGKVALVTTQFPSEINCTAVKILLCMTWLSV